MHRLLILCLAAAGLAVAIGASLPASRAALRAQPRRLGPIVTVVTGADWNLVAWRSAGGGFCYSYGAPGEAGSGCTPLPKARFPGPLVDGGAFPDHWRLLGLVSGVVRRVELRVPGRPPTTVRTRLVPPALHTRLRFYVLEFRLKRTLVPAGKRSRGNELLPLLAYDEHGRLVGRQRA